MGNASGREEDPAAAAEEGDATDDVEDGSARGFPPYGGGGGNHVPRPCSVGVVGASGGPGSPPGSPGRSLSPRMFVPQVIRSREIPHPSSSPFPRLVGPLLRSLVWCGRLVFRPGV